MRRPVPPSMKALARAARVPDAHQVVAFTWRDGRDWWVIMLASHVLPGKTSHMTCTRKLRDVADMAADYVATSVGLPVDKFRVAIRVIPRPVWCYDEDAPAGSQAVQEDEILTALGPHDTYRFEQKGDDYLFVGATETHTLTSDGDWHTTAHAVEAGA
jgi:hypothetical protein